MRELASTDAGRERIERMGLRAGQFVASEVEKGDHGQVAQGEREDDPLGQEPPPFIPIPEVEMAPERDTRAEHDARDD